MTALAIALEAGAVVAAALIAGFGPQKLLAEIEDPRRLTGVRLSAASAVVGLAVFAVAAGCGQPWLGCGLGMAAAWLTAVVLVDLRCMIIPDLHVACLAALAPLGPLASAPPRIIFGLLVGGGLMWLVREAFRRLRGVEAMGLGDVKLMAALGALAGPEHVLWIIVAGAMIGIGWILATHRGAMKAAPAIPFGAAAALPALIVIAFDRWPP